MLLPFDNSKTFYFNKVRGVRLVFYAQKNGEVNYPLHNSKFDFNEETIPLAIETLYGIINKMQYLSLNSQFD